MKDFMLPKIIGHVHKKGDPTRDSCDKEQRILLPDKNCWLPNFIDGIFEVC